MTKEEWANELQIKREREEQRMEERLKILEWKHIPEQYRPKGVKNLGDKIYRTNKEDDEEEEYGETAVSFSYKTPDVAQSIAKLRSPTSIVLASNNLQTR